MKTDKVMIKEDYKIFTDNLKCPNCGAICEDYQQDIKQKYKEEYCFDCDTQFGYEEKIEHIDDLDDWQGEQFGKIKVKYYWSYLI